MADSIPFPASGWRRDGSLLLSRRARGIRRLAAWCGQGILLSITCSSVLAVLFIFYYIFHDALPFFRLNGFREFFTSTQWYPSRNPASFGALAIFVGSALVTVGAAVVAAPLGVTAALCMSDVMPFGVRQWVKPVIEILAAIPSVAFGFFALVVFGPLLQERGGPFLAVAFWLLSVPLAIVVVVILGDLLASRAPARWRALVGGTAMVLLGILAAVLLVRVGLAVRGLEIVSGTNALNVSIILGIMAIPTVVSVSEDALQAVGRELREGCYALGATRAETLIHVILPAAGSGIGAAVILGVMRAIGETMVVWMASGNAAQIPQPIWNYLQPVRTLTATIAGDMGEADHVTGSSRYHVLFAMALCLLVIAFLCNLASEWAVRRTQSKAR